VPLLSPDFTARLDQAAAALRAGRTAEAVRLYRALIESFPDQVPPRISLGVLLLQTGAVDDAAAVLSRAAALAPNVFEAHYNLGLALAAQGRTDEAIVAYRAALGIQPESPAALANLAIVLRARGDTADAIAALRRAVRAAPEIGLLHLNLGTALHDARDLPAALESVQRATELEPQDVQAWVLRAHIEQRLGDLAAGAESLGRVLALDPQHTVAAALRSVLLQQIGRRDEAAKLLDFQNRLRARRLDNVPGYTSVAAFNTALAEQIQHHPTLAYEPENKSTVRGSQTREIFDHPTGALATLHGLVRQALADYMNLTMGGAPPEWHLQAWAVVLNSSGHQSAHIHAMSAVSGVYYVKIPDVVKAGTAGEAGFIRFGDPGDSMPQGKKVDGLQTAAVRPEEGMFVLFPAFYWHSTVPFDSTEPRICVAFDVVPGPAPAAS
jgi:uncharacterized protein (TIGR02466 family)